MSEERQYFKCRFPHITARNEREIEERNMAEFVYQIRARGCLKNFNGVHTIRSGKVYREPPPEQEMNAFRRKCCNGDGPESMFDLVDDDHLQVTADRLEVV
jgi:hypothetical protein